MYNVELHMLDHSTCVKVSQVYEDIYCNECKRKIVCGIVIYMYEGESYCSKRCRFKKT